MTAAYMESLQNQLDERTESLRQAVASIDRLTAVPLRIDVRDCDSGRVESLNKKLSQQAATIAALQKEVARGREVNARLVDENTRRGDEIVALKARTLAQPGDHEDVDILGRFFKRLVSQGRILVSADTLPSDRRPWVRVEPNRCWDHNRYYSDSRLGQILLGLKK